MTGWGLVALGMLGNWYHHLLLVQLRRLRSSLGDVPRSREYYVPVGGMWRRWKTGRVVGNACCYRSLRIFQCGAVHRRLTPYAVHIAGLFEYVACPHYLFEVIMWAGAVIIRLSA